MILILGPKSKNTVGLDAGVGTNQAINEIVWVNLLTGVPAKSDVHITMVVNDALRTAYNTANSANILSAAGFYTTTLTLTIPAGSTGAGVTINIPTTIPMDPSNSYGLGLTITSVDGGYTIAQNMKNLFIEFTLKNRYDGVYKMDIKTQGWSAYGITDENVFYPWGTSTNSILMITGGPNAVRIYDDFLFHDFIQSCHTGVGGGGNSGFGATAPRYTFNLATNQLIDVSNDIPDDGRNRRFRINTTVNPPAGNFWDPGTKKILASYIMSQTGRPDQFIDCIYTYRGPRP
jgi:hypothetical protein